MKKENIETLAKENLFNLIGKEWMLVTAGTKNKINTMTASWGGLGWLWNKPVAFIFIRPERYTHNFIEENSHLTISFYSEDYRKSLQICGSKSGRDIDKIKETGLTPIFTDKEVPTFVDARLTLECRKLFKSTMKEADFIDRDLLKWYNEQPGGSFHDVYVVEIENIYSK